MDSLESKYSSASGDSYVSQQSSDLQLTRARFEQVDQRLSCPVCFERFRDPRLLTCMHSFCKTCLENVLTKSPRNIEDDEKDQVSDFELHCPKCRKVTSLGLGGVEDLPVNYALKDVVEVMPEESVNSFSPSTPLTSLGHSLATLCDEHQRPMEYFCETDDQLVCGECLVMSKHRGHDTIVAKKILERELESLRVNSFESTERMLLKVREAVDNVSNMADSLREKGEKTKTKIQRHFKEIRDALELREQSLLGTTEDIVMRKVDKLDMQREVLAKSKIDLELQVLKLKHILANKDDFSFLKNKDKLLSELSQVVELAKSKDRNPLESINDGPDCFLPNDLLTMACKFGEVYCRPCPSRFTARGEGLSKGFVNKPVKFKVEARDRYNQRSIVSGTSVRVMVQDPQHNQLTTHVEETTTGEYLVSYTPTQVGYHLIRITANDHKILNGDSHAVIFNRKDYFSLGVPLKKISKSELRTEPPVSTFRSVATLPNGNVVFMDAFCLRVVNPSTGTLVHTIGSYGTAPNQFSLPFGMAINRSGNIFVSDSTMHRISKFSSEGRHIANFGSQGQRVGMLQCPEGLALLGEERVYVADSGNNRIQYFLQRNGKFQGCFGRKGTNAGQFISPRDVAVDVKNSRILVSDTGNFRIQALSLDGKPLLQFGNPKGGSVYLSFPFFVTVDEDGFILVTETKSHYISVLTPRGGIVRRLGSQGDAPGQFRTPYGICVSSNKGHIIVTDSTSNCIQIF